MAEGAGKSVNKQLHTAASFLPAMIVRQLSVVIRTTSVEEAGFHTKKKIRQILRQLKAPSQLFHQMKSGRPQILLRRENFNRLRPNPSDSLGRALLKARNCFITTYETTSPIKQCSGRETSNFIENPTSFQSVPPCRWTDAELTLRFRFKPQFML